MMKTKFKLLCLTSRIVLTEASLIHTSASFISQWVYFNSKMGFLFFLIGVYSILRWVSFNLKLGFLLAQMGLLFFSAGFPSLLSWGSLNSKLGSFIAQLGFFKFKAGFLHSSAGFL